MPYNFRNRERIKAPTRFEDPEDEHRQVSYEEPDIDQEVYAPSPMSSRVKYLGPAKPFNPNLRPAAFPTLDASRQAQPQETQIINLDTPSLYDEEEIHSSVNKIRIRQASAASSKNIQQIVKHPSVAFQPHNQKNPMVSTQDWCALQAQHDGTSVSIQPEDMERVQQAANMGPFNRTMLEMESSEDEAENSAQGRQQKAFGKWGNLTSAHKLQLFDIVAEAYPTDHPNWLLRLNEKDVRELQALSIERDERLFREQAAGKRHRKELHQRLLRGAIMSEEKFRRLLEQNIYRQRDEKVNEDDFDLSTAFRVNQARAYLRYCRLDAKLLDNAWAHV